MPKLVWVNDEVGYRCPKCSLFVCITKKNEEWCPRCDDAPKPGWRLIGEERLRQIIEEGWTPEHDATHKDDDLARAAAAYATPARLREQLPVPFVGLPALWPWDFKYWKPTPDDRIRELVKAGALIAAEIDRLQAQAQS